MNDTDEGVGVGGDLVLRLDPDHPAGSTCPGCDADLRTVAITHLAYTFETCRCDRADYPHLRAQLWHLGCLKRSAPTKAAARLLEVAAWALERGQRTAQRQAVIERIQLWVGGWPEPIDTDQDDTLFAGPCCVVCGCSQNRACETGCTWAGDHPALKGPVCSECV